MKRQSEVKIHGLSWWKPNIQDLKIDIGYALVIGYTLNIAHKQSFGLYASQENIIIWTAFKKIKNLKKKTKNPVIARPQ